MAKKTKLPESVTQQPVEVKKGFKVTNKDFTCLGFKFEIGKKFHQPGNIVPCSNGFHYCEVLADCFGYYSFSTENRVFEIIDHGATRTDGDKCCTSDIEFVRELSWLEVLELVNTGKGNTGLKNAGSDNAGSDNAGNRNAGNRNAGSDNAGSDNAGSDNAGSDNAGSYNAGNRNAGYSNAGSYNAGNRNAGNRNAGSDNAGSDNAGSDNAGSDNAGSYNAGNRNAGYSNAGSDNAGNRNAGNRNAGSDNAGSDNAGSDNAGSDNAGSYNAGNRNAGYSNAGSYNAGNRNAGYSNAGSDNAGAFNNLQANYVMFNKPSSWTYDDFISSKAYSLLSSIETTMWVPNYAMSDQEKKDHPYYETTGGFIKHLPYKESFTNAWNNWSESSREAFTSLPNFNADVFFDITGVQV